MEIKIAKSIKSLFKNSKPTYQNLCGCTDMCYTIVSYAYKSEFINRCSRDTLVTLINDLFNEHYNKEFKE